ncbi:S-layer homology domain-containing protein [Paenibacillus sp. chi10]|uniref:S-layer homology domain-containing protein n=1 Tax=Paenibacillus suaedae TaxID=3077233 RepID=A0AAJ2JV78_9BACL|nr:S-layer homology domain-containing protein [Paenibacillus sp. chi10]MDT8976521.1 S-layer homology domain-containing protein [Paenibacillus sp. chi10]
MKRLMSALLCLMLVLTAHSGSVQAKGNDVSAVSEQQYTRIGEDYDILDDNVLLEKKNGSVWTWVLNKDYLKTLDFYVGEMYHIPGLQDVKQFRYKSREMDGRDIINYVALKKDGTVWYWDSKTGEADATIIHSPMNTPSPIKDLDNVTSLVADFFDSSNFKTLFVLKSDGSVWSWGREMGNASSIPIQSKLLDDVASINSANGFAYAVKKDGTVWRWSTSSYLPDYISKNKGPEQIKGLVNIVNIQISSYKNFAFKQDGTVWSWPAYNPEAIPKQLAIATGARAMAEFSMMLRDQPLIDQFIDTMYFLHTDDQLWSVYNDDKVFPELTDIATIYLKHRDKYSTWYYALKKDQTLWAWDDYDASLPKLVVFTKGIAADIRSETTEISKSKRPSRTQTPNGERSGTTEIPTEKRPEAVVQPEKQTSPEISLYPFITMLQPGELQPIIATNVVPGTRIMYTIENPGIGTLANVNGVPVVKGITPGQTIVRATISRPGLPNETTYVLLYVMGGSMQSNTYLTAVRSLPDIDKQNPQMVEGLTQAGELVITAASSEKLTPVNGQFVITSELLARLAGNASKQKSAIQQTLSENKITLVRELIVNAEIVTVSNQSEYMFKLDKEGLVGRKDIDYITVHAGDAKLVFNVATAERLFQSQPVIVIRLVKESNGGYRVQFQNEQGQELSGIPSNIQLILPTSQIDATNTSVFYVNGKAREPIGGKYNPSKNGMEAEINRSGTYLVEENSKSFPDMNGRDPELMQAVQFLGSKGIVSGKGNGNFMPDSLLTRAEFTTMLVKAFNAMDETAKESFSDVEPPQWHYPFISSSEKNHIVEGYPDGTFKPDRTIERQEMTAIGARFLHERKHYYYPSNPEEYLNLFVDKETVSKWAKPTMSLAVKQRLIDVPANKQIKAREAVTRGEAARMLYRLYLQL